MTRALTLIAVFLPTAFMSGIAGKFFKQFGWTASLAVFASLVVARMLTNSFARMLVLAPIIGAVCGGLGMFISYHIDVSPGATIILLASTLFLVVYVGTGTRGRLNAAGLVH